MSSVHFLHWPVPDPAGHIRTRPNENQSVFPPFSFYNWEDDWYVDSNMRAIVLPPLSSVLCNTRTITEFIWCWPGWRRSRLQSSNYRDLPWYHTTTTTILSYPNKCFELKNMYLFIMYNPRTLFTILKCIHIYRIRLEFCYIIYDYA